MFFDKSLNNQKVLFIDIENDELLKQKTSVCYQSTSVTKIDFRKKKKTISFIVY